MKLLRLLSRAALVAAGVMALLGVSGMTANAAESSPHVTAAVSTVDGSAQLLSDPPGWCEAWEEGDIKIDRFGILYECYDIPGEGYYWLPF